MNWGSFIATICTLVAGFGGLIYQASAQNELWRRDTSLKFAQELMNRRIEIFRSMSLALVEGQRISLYYKARDPKQGDLLVKVLSCATSADDVTKCDITTADDKTIAFAKELFDIHLRFEAARVATKHYFCRNTSAALAEFPSGPWWWNAASGKRKNLLIAMESEIDCGLDDIVRSALRR